MEQELNNAMEQLGQLRHLRAETEMLSARIGELEMAAQGGVLRITGMPRGMRRGDRVADCAARLADMRALLTERRLRCLDELARLYAYIEAIDDSLIRQIFTYRYVDGLTWQQVARALGETDEQYPRRLHNRYLRERLEGARFSAKI